MKIAILADTHFGARNDHDQFRKYFEKFYDEVFFPTIDDMGITHVIHLGDLVERRKHINFLTLESLKNSFVAPCKQRGLKVTMILGNHDVYFRDTNRVNGPLLLFEESWEGLDLITGPTTRHFKAGDDYLEVVMLPWITKDNYEAAMSLVKGSKAPVCMAHLELSGHEQYKGLVSKEGMSWTHFTDFQKVFSGHYHHRSVLRNVTYVGSPYEIVWSDYITDQDPKGFHIFDTETLELTLIPNPYKIFWKVENKSELPDDAKDCFIRTNNAELAADLANQHVEIQVISDPHKDVELDLTGDDTLVILERAAETQPEIGNYLKKIYFKALELQVEA